MEEYPRVAFFPDTYSEIDGVANTSRQFEAYAKKRGLPFLTVCGGAENKVETDGAVTRVTRCRGPIGFPLDKHHRFDLAFWRHYNFVEQAVRKFGADVVHLTGPSDVGQLGALLAHRLSIPLAASWHTNLHEYAEQRASTLIRFLPQGARKKIDSLIRKSSLSAVLRFYKIPRVLFAPNRELIDMLAAGTGKPVFPMQRGVDSTLFRPEQRGQESARVFTIGYVGRLTTEKNIRFLAEIERSLLESGFSHFRFLIIGQGEEEAWLKANLRKADFTGVLNSTALARGYASMDVFVFPSRTDTYGNVVLEALASGVPVVVTNAGGPQFLISHGETGFIASTLAEFVSCIRRLAEQPQQLQAMREAARNYALRASWDQIFEGVYAVYERELRHGGELRRRVRVRPQPSVASPRLS
jgi:glycosyltransferase involved in cell wall biosynthesis